MTAAAPVGAQTASGVDFTVGDNATDSAGLTLGYRFTANARVGVVGLATWDSWVTAPGAAIVGLWNAAGALFASALTRSSPTIGSADWSYASITPVAPTPGATYIVGSFAGDASHPYLSSGFMIDPRISFIQDAWIASSSLQLPGNAGFINGLVGGGSFRGDVIRDDVPESPTWAMTLAGFAAVGLVGYLASRRRAASAG